MPRLLALALPSALLLLPADAFAKDLRGRFGLGFRQSFDGTTVVTSRYTLPTPEPLVQIQAEAFCGFSANRIDGTWTLVGGRALMGFVVEDNMNLYGAAGAGLYLESGNSQARIQPALGSEFFLFGLENLGIIAEWGVDIDLGSPSAVGTTAAVGVHYWF